MGYASGRRKHQNRRRQQKYFPFHNTSHVDFRMLQYFHLTNDIAAESVCHLLSTVGAGFSDVAWFEFFPARRADQCAPINPKTTKAIIIKIRQPQQPLGLATESPNAPKLSRIKHSNRVIHMSAIRTAKRIRRQRVDHEKLFAFRTIAGLFHLSISFA